MARKTSGSSCGRTGSQIGSSNPSTISSITAATLGTPSLINLGKSCPSRAATGQPWVTQCEDWYYSCALPSAVQDQLIGARGPHVCCTLNCVERTRHPSCRNVPISDIVTLADVSAAAEHLVALE